MNKIQLFFSRLFPNIILKNRIVATIVYNTGIRLSQMKHELDTITNTDI
jgi:hypothetical protein